MKNTTQTHWTNLSTGQIEEVMALTEKETHDGLTAMEAETLEAYRKFHGA